MGFGWGVSNYIHSRCFFLLSTGRSSPTPEVPSLLQVVTLNWGCIARKSTCLPWNPGMDSQNHIKLDLVAHTYNLSPGKVEAGESEIQGHPQLYGKFKASLGYMRLLSQTSKQKSNHFTVLSALFKWLFKRGFTLFKTPNMHTQFPSCQVSFWALLYMLSFH